MRARARPLTPLSSRSPDFSGGSLHELLPPFGAPPVPGFVQEVFGLGVIGGARHVDACHRDRL